MTFEELYCNHPNWQNLDANRVALPWHSHGIPGLVVVFSSPHTVSEPAADSSEVLCSLADRVEFRWDDGVQPELTSISLDDPRISSLAHIISNYWNTADGTELEDAMCRHRRSLPKTGTGIRLEEAYDDMNCLRNLRDGFTPFHPHETGLPFTIYTNDCAYPSDAPPLVLYTIEPYNRDECPSLIRDDYVRLDITDPMLEHLQHGLCQFVSGEWYRDEAVDFWHVSHKRAA